MTCQPTSITKSVDMMTTSFRKYLAAGISFSVQLCHDHSNGTGEFGRTQPDTKVSLVLAAGSYDSI